MAQSAPKNCVTNTCTEAEMAAYDIYDWQQQLQGYTTGDDITVPPMLPSAQGVVAARPGGAANEYRVTSRWDDDRDGDDGTDCPPDSDDDLDCYWVDITF